jgi:hypothetical protein
MQARRNTFASFAWALTLGLLFFLPQPAHAAPRKPHIVGLGVAKRVSYTKAGDPAGASASETDLKIRPLLVDGSLREWTTGESHDVTDRSFVVRRALRINDSLPGDKQEHWVWQRGPWLLVDRVTGHAVPLKLPEYEPGVSQVSWFRDYAAYCGVTASGKSLYAVVAQVAARKPVLARKIDSFDPDPRDRPDSVCGAPEWQREPLRVTFQTAGKGTISFDIVPGSAVLVEDSSDEPDTPEPITPAKAN